MTLIEVIAIIVVMIVAGVGILAVRKMLWSQHMRGSVNRDSYWLRGFPMAFDIWAQSNNGSYPLPSLVDINDTTVTGSLRSKDTTANIYSLLIWNGLVPTEMMVSRAEVNGNIEEFRDYSVDKPSSAVDPANALWDPAFRADFTTGTGHTSYAHLMPSKDRLHLWRSGSPASTPVIGNRGPRTTLTDGVYTSNPDSNTMLIHGGRTTWEGHIAYADGSVRFETTMTPKNKSDHIFFDEPAPANAYLGIFTTAGDDRKDFTAIWD